MIAYKPGKHGDTRVVITLEIPEDALTNLNRNDIVAKETAEYRASKVKVLKIEDEAGNEQKEAGFEDWHEKNGLKYGVGEVAEEPLFDTDLEKNDAKGIHFFLTRRLAELYGLRTVENGLFEKWWCTGQKHEEVPCVAGKMEGLYQNWWPNGQKRIETTYVAGNVEGLYQQWHDNGKKWVEGYCVHDKKVGDWKTWHYHGTQEIETHFDEGKVHGPYLRWFSNGIKWVDATYVNGHLEGLYQQWYSNGQCEFLITFSNGKAIESKSWTYYGEPSDTSRFYARVPFNPLL